MKYINGIPEGTEQSRTDKAKRPRRTNHKEQWYIQQMKLDPSLKEEHAKHMEFRDWEKEMHDPGEIEHKREMVASLRGEKPIKKKPEEKAKTVLREPLEPVANLYPYCNFKFPRLVRGDNHVKITGKVKITFTCECPVMVGG